MKGCLSVGVALCLLLLCHYKASGQAAVYRHYTTNEGLPGSRIYRICQDSKGFLWLTTNAGLSCFNGYHFKNLPPDLFHKASLIALAIDDSDRVWTANGDRGLYCISNGKVKEINVPGNNIPPYIIHLCADHSGRVWLITRYSQCGYIYGGRYVPFAVEQKGQRLKLNAMHAAQDGSVILATGMGMYRCSREGVLSAVSPDIPQQAFYSISHGPDGRDYFGTTGAVYRMLNDRVDSFSVRMHLPICNIAVIDTGHIWLATNQTGFLLRSAGKETRFSKYTGTEKSFIDDIYEDGRGCTFFATYNNGLLVINHPNITRYPDKEGTIDNEISCIAAAGGNIYIGGFGGVYTCRGDGPPVRMNKFPVAPTERINKILCRGDEIWAGSPMGIYRYNLKTQRLRRITGDSCTALSLAAGEGDGIYVGSYSGFWLLDATSHKRVRMRHAAAPDLRINDIYYSRKTGLWLATEHGAQHYSNGRWHDLQGGNSLVGGCNAVIADSDGNMWLAGDKGLAAYDAAGRAHVYTTKDGLPANCCNGVFLKGNTLWIGTSKGIASLRNGIIRNYITVTGLPAEGVNAVYQDDRGDLWLCTSIGLYRWKIKEERFHPTVYPVTVTSVNGNAAAAGAPVFPYRHNSVLFTFTSPNYTAPDNILYEYRLAEIDSLWHRTPGQTIQYSQLQPGTYTFEVRAGYANGRDRSGVTRYVFHISRPFWKTWWFACLVIILSAVVTIMAIWLRLRYIRMKERQRSEQYIDQLQLKQQAVNALISPHFIFNALNSVQHFINVSDALSANRYLSKFAQLIRTTMENSVKLSVPLAEELRMLELYLSLEAVRMHHKLHYEIEVDENVDRKSTMIPTMLIQPFAENAIWHGINPGQRPGHVHIRIGREEGQLRVVIRDNGVGFDPAALRKEKGRRSWGMRLNEERLRIIEKITGQCACFDIHPIYVHHEIKGTEVILHIPVMTTEQ